VNSFIFSSSKINIIYILKSHYIIIKDRLLLVKIHYIIIKVLLLKKD